CCSSLTILQLCRVCCTINCAVQDYMRMAFAININQRLAHFFSNPLEFWSLQAHTGMVISGSSVLSFFEKSELPTLGGLDIV
ncbi:hypothetical protein C8T65DRAFT_531484, partial [Cerioporus squamosus]